MRKFVFGLAATVALCASSGLAAGSADVGPKADVAAVKVAEHKAAPGNTIGGVHVIGNYALVQWYGNPEGSGPEAFKKVGGTWKRILAGGGVVSVGDLVKAGIPAGTARQLCTGWMKALGSNLCQGIN